MAAINNENSIFTHILTSNVHRDTILVSKSRFWGVKESIYDVIQGLTITKMSDLQDNFSLIAKFV